MINARPFTSCEDDLADKLTAMYTADSTSVGLSNSASPAYVRVWTTEDDANYDRQQHTTNWPKVVLSIELTTFDQFNRGGWTANVRFACHFDREASTPVAGNVNERAVIARMYNVFHRIAPSDATDWKFSPLVLTRQFGGPSDGKVSQRIIEGRITAVSSSGV